MIQEQQAQEEFVDLEKAKGDMMFYDNCEQNTLDLTLSNFGSGQSLVDDKNTTAFKIGAEFQIDACTLMEIHQQQNQSIFLV